MSFVVTDSNFFFYQIQPDLLQVHGKKPQISTVSRGESSSLAVRTDQDIWYIVKVGAVLLSMKVHMITT